jgi:hypothetical protein
MMIVMRRAICCFFLVGACLLTAEDSPTETLGLKNGRFWNALPSDSRPYFLIGMFEGWTFRQRRENSISIKEAKVFWASAKFPAVDVTEMVTSVYREPENLNLPIAWVTMACFSVQRGETTRDAVFMTLRKNISTEMQRTDAHPANEIDPIDIILSSRPK